MAGATMKGTGTGRTMITATGMHMGMIGTEAKATNMATDTTSNDIPTT
jgi:hypothetical protein